MAFEHQDWEPKVLKKVVPKTQTIQVKPTTSGPKVQYNEDGETEVVIKKVTKEMGKLISTTRNEKGLKQEQLAQQCNIDKATINRIEQGNENYNFQQINSIAKVLGIKIPRK